MRTTRTKKAKQNSARVETVTVGSVKVKLYTRVRGDYNVHEIADYSTGKRRLRSFSDHAKARQEAERIARLMSSGEAHAASLTGKEAASFGRASELIRETCVSIELAAASFAEAFKILGGNRIVEAARFFTQNNTEGLPQKTVKEVADEFIAARQARAASERYLADLRFRLTHFARDFKVNIASVTSPDLQRWFDGKKLSRQSVRNFRTVIGTLFGFAERRGYLRRGTNPVRFTETVKVKRTAGIEIFSPAELAKLLATAAPEFVPCLAIGAFAGLRSAEILRLSWADIDLGEGGHVCVSADNSKTASRRLVPVTPALRTWLMPHVGKGQIWKGNEREFYFAQEAAAEAAGIEWRANALRHSFVSYRLADVQSAAQVALEAGNSPQMVFRHYREVVKPIAAKAWFGVLPESPANVVALEAAS
jgi:integrase